MSAPGIIFTTVAPLSCLRSICMPSPRAGTPLKVTRAPDVVRSPGRRASGKVLFQFEKPLLRAQLCGEFVTNVGRLRPTRDKYWEVTTNS